MAVRTLVVRRPGELEQLGRTLRALAMTAVAAEDAGADLGKAIAGTGPPAPAIALPRSAPASSAATAVIARARSVRPSCSSSPGLRTTSVRTAMAQYAEG